jgi:hypothetical protein
MNREITANISTSPKEDCGRYTCVHWALIVKKNPFETYGVEAVIVKNKHCDSCVNYSNYANKEQTDD